MGVAVPDASRFADGAKPFPNSEHGDRVAALGEATLRCVAGSGVDLDEELPHRDQVAPVPSLGSGIGHNYRCASCPRNRCHTPRNSEVLSCPHLAGQL